MEKSQQQYDKKIAQAQTLENKNELLTHSLSLAEYMQIGYIATSEIEPTQKNYNRVNKQEQVIERIKEKINDNEVKLGDLKQEINVLENLIAQMTLNELEMKKNNN